MQIIEIIGDVSQAKRELAALKDLEPARLQRCTTAIHDLEETLEELITIPWVPRTLPGIEGAVLKVIQNIEQLENSIAEAGGPVLENKLPDEMLRFNVALLDLAAMRFTLKTLLEAAAALLVANPPTLEYVN